VQDTLLPLEDKVKLTRFLALCCLTVVVLAMGVSAQTTDWKGFYLGGNVGVNISHSDATTVPIFSPTGYFAATSPPAIGALSPQHPDSTGFVGGGQAGYNFQGENFVFGVEADLGAMTGSGTRSSSGTYPCCAPTGFTVTQKVGHSWLLTARPRMALALGKALIYGTGGLAVTHINYQAVFTDTFATAHENGGVDDTKVGWTAGAGFEYKVAQRWSIKGEYLYAKFGDLKTSTNLTAFAPPIAFPTNVFTHSVDLHPHIVRFGFNYHF
jgi:outer membrane immunogenic protein